MKFESRHAKRISYVLTTKNRADYLEKTLSVVKELLKPDDELIVVDGGSQDHTLDVLKKYSGVVSAFVSEPDVSISHAFNKGVLLARGKYVKQLYDDDLIYPDAMQSAASVLDANPGVDVLVCGGTKDDGKKKIVVYVNPGTNYGVKTEDPFKYKACGTGFVMRRSVFAKVGLFPTGWAGDKVFIAQCIAKGATIKFCRINLFHHPVYEHSIIKSRKSAHEKDVAYAIRQYCSRQYYIYYRLKTFLYRIKMGWLVRRISFWGRILRTQGIRHAFMLFKRKLSPEISDGPRTYQWDGGFS